MMRKLMWFTIGFAAACALGAYAFSNWLWMLFGLCMICFSTGLIFRKRWKMRYVTAVALGILIGLGWFGGYRYYYLSAATEADGSQRSLSAVITDYGVPNGYGQTVEAKITIDQRTYRAVLYLKDSNELKPGDKVKGLFKLRMNHEGLEEET